MVWKLCVCDDKHLMLTVLDSPLINSANIQRENMQIAVTSLWRKSSNMFFQSLALVWQQSDFQEQKKKLKTILPKVCLGVCSSVTQQVTQINTDWKKWIWVCFKAKVLIGKLSTSFSLSYMVEMAIHLKNEYLMFSYKIIHLNFWSVPGWRGCTEN